MTTIEMLIGGYALLVILAGIYIAVIVRKQLRRNREEFVSSQLTGALEGSLDPFVKDLNRGSFK